MDGTIYSGQVIELKIDRGFGFIRRAANGNDVFFHMSELPHDLPFYDLPIGQRVTFQIETREKGPLARNIQAAK